MTLKEDHDVILSLPFPLPLPPSLLLLSLPPSFPLPLRLYYTHTQGLVLTWIDRFQLYILEEDSDVLISLSLSLFLPPSLSLSSTFLRSLPLLLSPSLPLLLSLSLTHTGAGLNMDRSFSTMHSGRGP